MRTGLAVAAAVVISVAAGACVRPVTSPPPPAGTRFPDFVYPAPFDGSGDQRARQRLDAAWQRLQAGDVSGAEAAFAGIVSQRPGYYPAAVGWGYALLAQGRSKDALIRFNDAIRLAPRYAPALAGRAEAQLAAGERDAALAGFEAALESDSALGDLRRRIDVLKFDRVREMIAAASRAAAAGRLEEAREAYLKALAASPESGFLYRDLGIVEFRRKNLAAAEKALAQAIAIDSADAKAYLGLADVLERRGDLAGATAALEQAFALDPTDTLKARLDRALGLAESGTVPAEYDAIGGRDQVTRGDLAALVGVRLRDTLAANRSGSNVLATDVRGHWAAAWIIGVIRSGVMDVFPNHTFQPQVTVRRADLAQVVSRVLALGGPGVSRESRVRVTMGDVSMDHLSYREISAAVASGAMALDGGLFRPARVVSGREAIDTIQRLERLVRRARGGGR